MDSDDILCSTVDTLLQFRAQAAEALARYEDQVEWTEEKIQPSGTWLLERKAAYEACGSGLLAFATSNAFVANLFYRLWPKKARYYARSAGSSFMSLARADPGTHASEQFHAQILSALKLAYAPAARSKPGKVLLVCGVIVYLAACYVAFRLGPSRREFAGVLISAPVVMALLALPLGWVAFWIGTVTGTPLVSFTYAFGAMKRVWRGIIGASLLVTVALAFGTLILPYLSRI